MEVKYIDDIVSRAVYNAIHIIDKETGYLTNVRDGPCGKKLEMELDAIIRSSFISFIELGNIPKDIEYK